MPEDAGLNEFLMRLFAPMGLQDAQFVVGKLLDKLPMDVPIPQGGRIVGSVVHGKRQVQIVLDAPQTPDQVVEFYRQQLTAAGWKEQNQFAMRGFTHGNMPSNLMTFCPPAHNQPGLTLTNPASR